MIAAIDQSTDISVHPVMPWDALHQESNATIDNRAAIHNLIFGRVII
jgi:hypothetical protein